MGKAGKGNVRSGNKAGTKATAAADNAANVELKNDLKKTAAPEPVVKAAELPAKRPFDVNAYVKSMAWVYPVLLLLIVLVMFYFRAVPSHDAVFTSWAGNYVNVAEDDAVLQMRMVYNTLAHFPERIFYDPFTHFPYGSKVHFGPLFTLLIAGTSLVVGLGNPSTALVGTVGAYMPTILGALCAIPTYFIARKMFGRKAGLIAAATLAVLPGQFLARSLLGFTDHHIAEVLFSITTVMFLIYALDAAKSSGLNFEKLRARDKTVLPAVLYSALAGFAFGLYMLTWSGGLLIGMVLFIYFVVQTIVDHLKGHSIDYVPIIAGIMFLLSALMLLPYSLTDLSFQLMYYSITQPFFLTLAAVGVGAVYVVSVLLRKNKAEAWTFPVTLVGIGVVGLLLAFIAAPQVYGLIMAGLNVFAPTGGMLTVAEARPTYMNSAGQFDLGTIWEWFLWTFPMAIVGLVLLTFKVFKDNRPAEWLFFVWNLIMLWAMLSQNRFTYYFAVNAALLTGYFVYAVFRAFDWGRFTENWKKKVKSIEDAKAFVNKYTGQTMLFTVLGLIFVVLIAYPATSLSIGVDPGKIVSGQQSIFDGITQAYSRSSPGMDHNWYSTLLWMKNNTPDPQGDVVSPTFDYASGTYTAPADGERYAYPSSAYGVMSWWDYGHMITYVAERIPNANPFQAGILENNGTGGSARFFLATSEDKGYQNLQNLGSRYVVIDNDMATGKFYAITEWANDKDNWFTSATLPGAGGRNQSIPVDSGKYHSSMMSRLYYDDAYNMSHFRLVYESPGDYIVSIKYAHLDTGAWNPYAAMVEANYTTAYYKYVTGIDPVAYSDMEILYDARPPEKEIKVYEVVKGATITGRADPGTSVTATLNMSLANRPFQYQRKATTDSNGVYSMTVSYPSEAMLGAGYKYDVKPDGIYSLAVGNTTLALNVPEKAVMNGETVSVV